MAAHYTDPTNTVIDMGDGRFVPVNLSNIDYVDLVSSGVDILPAPVEQVDPDYVAAERMRRLGLGFDYNFGDARGVHRIGTSAADMIGWGEVSTYAGALLDSGDVETHIAIVTDTGPTQVTAPEWRAIEIAAAAFRQPIWTASFVLLSQSPIPEDYSDARHWP